MNEVSSVECSNLETMVKLRMDVDYAYPSRLKSFFYTFLGIKTGQHYLKNSKIMARMINESTRSVKSYWFFTPTTTPDKELLALLGEDKHEVCLHVVTHPEEELQLLEQATKRQINYYTVHGTERLLARLMWGRKLSEAKVPIPKGFPLKSFHDFPTTGIDRLSYANPPETVVKTAENSIRQGQVLHFHPEWLFQRGTINHRGPFYEPLRRILQVDKELETISVRKKGFARIAKQFETKEYQQDSVPTERFLEKLWERGTDIFTFLERKWCCPISNPPKIWHKAEDNIALLKVTTYDDWLVRVGKKTRNMIRKAEKSGIKIELSKPNDKLIEGIWKIYNETPIRQGRAFPHYGQSLQTVKAGILAGVNDTYVVAYLQDEVIGFIHLVYGDRISIISQILSQQKHSDKAVNNALVAKAVEVCASKQCRWIMYGRMGNHPSLDHFKENNGFAKLALTRYYIPITWKGRVAMQLRLHTELKDALPQRIKYPLIPAYNWVSRNKTRMRSYQKQ